jgi:hypothetical protein
MIQGMGKEDKKKAKTRGRERVTDAETQERGIEKASRKRIGVTTPSLERGGQLWSKQRVNSDQAKAWGSFGCGAALELLTVATLEIGQS